MTIPDDQIFESQFPELQRSLNVMKALASYDILTPSLKKDIQDCELSLTGAIKRCEKIHGAGNCESITPTYAGPKCPENTERVGCCTCAPRCPTGYKDQQILCQKPKSYIIKPRPTQQLCYLANAADCVQYGKIWTQACKSGFTRVGSSLCVATCPANTSDTGASCLKNNLVEVGDIFSWTHGDE